MPLSYLFAPSAAGNTTIMSMVTTQTTITANTSSLYTAITAPVMAANSLTVGDVFQFDVWVNLNNQAVATAFNVKLYHNGNLALTLTSTSPASAQVNKGLHAMIRGGVRTLGGGGTIMVVGDITTDFSATPALASVASTPLAVNTTVANTFDIRCNFDVANAGNSGRIQLATYSLTEA